MRDYLFPLGMAATLLAASLALQGCAATRPETTATACLEPSSAEWRPFEIWTGEDGQPVRMYVSRDGEVAEILVDDTGEVVGYFVVDD